MLNNDSIKTERRRMPRLAVSQEQFRLSQTGKIFSVVDLSLGGMGIRMLDAEDARLFQVAAQAAGTLKFDSGKWEVTAQVRSIRKGVVGLSFENPSSGLLAELQRRLDPAELGRSLRLRPGGEGGALWYHGTSGTDVLVSSDAAGVVQAIQVFALGIFVHIDRQVSAAPKLRTGRAGYAAPAEANDSERRAERADLATEVRGILRFDTVTLFPDEAPDSAKLAIAKTLLDHANLPADLKHWVSEVRIQ